VDSPAFLVINITGRKVGIGAAIPAANLHVNGSTAAELRLESNAGTSQDIHLKSSSREYALGKYGGSNSFFINDVTAGADRFIINTNGYVGIGTTAPAAKLEVNNALRLTPTTAPSVTCSASTEGTMFYNTTSNRICYCDGVSYKRVDANGAC